MSGASDAAGRAVISASGENLHDKGQFEKPGETFIKDAAGRDCFVDPVRMEVFIEAMTPPGPAHLRELERQALAAGVPIIRPQTQNLLRFFLRMKAPESILEIGTAVGFSALFMRHYAPPGCRIVTIEQDAERARSARENFAAFTALKTEIDSKTDSEIKAETVTDTKTGSETKTDINTTAETNTETAVSEGGIELLEGDAAQILPSIREDSSFDLIFMDAAKGQYLHFLPEVLRLLRSGGILLTDNILQEGDILSSRFAVTRRNRTIHSRMRAYLRALMEEPALETLLLPTGDGSAVSVKKAAVQNL